MCQFYPDSRTCCGIPLRVGLIFIALLAIITGALINAAIKKVGVNVSSIQDVRDLSRSKNSSKLQAKPRAQRAAPDMDYFENLRDAVIVPTRRPRPTTVWMLSTVEIIGEDGHTEIISFQDDSDTVVPTETTTKNTTTTTRRVRTVTTRSTTTPAAKVNGTTKDMYAVLMGKINRNGLNFLAIAFIVLGIMLMIANFMNSPEVAMIWVACCLVVCVVSLVLLLSVVGECARDADSCLLRHLDWLSAFLVGLFWFLYIFVWFYFAAVGNGLATSVSEV